MAVQAGKRFAPLMAAWQVISPSNNLSSLSFDKSVRTPIIRSPYEVLVKVHASSINPLDVMMTRGYGSRLLDFWHVLDECFKAPRDPSCDRYPLILGRDFSGEIVDKGMAVNSFNIGDQVIGVCPPQASGCHAEYTTTHFRMIARKPDNVGHVEAAALPYCFLSACSAVLTGGLSQRCAPNKRVLVLGGSGGVGTVAIQLLQTWGAFVTTTCSKDSIEWLQRVTGVEECIDYNTVSFSDFRDEFDLILDFRPPHPVDMEAMIALKETGFYVTLSSPLLRNVDEYGVLPGLAQSLIDAGRDTLTILSQRRSIRWAFFRPSPDALAYLSQLIAEDKIRPTIQKVYQFNQLLEAYGKVQDGHLRGKIVVQM